jgi:hypothetical protein
LTIKSTSHTGNMKLPALSFQPSASGFCALAPLALPIRIFSSRTG